MSSVFLGCEVVGAWIMVWGWRRFVRRPGAWTVGACFLLGSHVMTEAPVMWGPTLIPLPLALASVALWAALEEGNPGAELVIGVSLAAAAECHVVCAPLLVAAPWLLIAMHRPIHLAVAVLVSGVVVLALGSPDAWINNVRVLPGVLAAIGSCVAIVSAFGIRRISSKWRAETRRDATLFGWVLAGVATAVVAALGAPVLNPRYLAPALPALSLVAGLAVSAASLRAKIGSSAKWFGRFPAVDIAVSVLLCLWLATQQRDARSPGGWTWGDIARVSAALRARGWSYTDIRRDLVAEWVVLMTLATMDERLGQLPRAERSELAVLRVPAECAVPPGVKSVELKEMDHVAWLLPTAAVLHRDDPRVCYERSDQEPTCIELGVPADEVHFTDRAYLARDELRERAPSGAISRVRHSFELEDQIPGSFVAAALDPGWIIRRKGVANGKTIALHGPFNKGDILDVELPVEVLGTARVQHWPVAILVVREGVIPPEVLASIE